MAAAVLSHKNVARWWIALAVCILGVLSGDVVLYWSGRHWGERLLNRRVVRLVLNAERERRLKGAYRRVALRRHPTNDVDALGLEALQVRQTAAVTARSPRGA